MTNRTALILFVLGFLLWYANRKKTAVAVASLPGTTGGSVGQQSLVAAPTTTTTTTGLYNGLTDGIPNALKGVGFSYESSTHEGSLWLNTRKPANVTISLATGSTGGVGWQTDTVIPAVNLVLGSWGQVVRVNPNVLGVGGLLPNMTFYVTVSYPDNVSETVTLEVSTVGRNTANIITVPLVPTTKPAITNGILNSLKGAGFSWDANTHEGSFWLNVTGALKVSVEAGAGTISGGAGWQEKTAYVPEQTNNSPWVRVQRLNPTVLGQAGIMPNSTYYFTVSDAANGSVSTVLKVTTGATSTVGIVAVALVHEPKPVAPTNPVVVPPAGQIGTRVSSIQYADDNPGGGVTRMSDIVISWNQAGTLATLSGGVMPGAGGDYSHYILIDGEGLHPAPDKLYNAHTGNLSDFGAFAPNTHLTLHSFVARGNYFGDLENGSNNTYKMHSGYANIYIGTKP